jgi:beta-lactamase superfamily II metal-dependent hydrolase
MAFEIDFLAVGEGERSGDAFAIRFGNLNGTREEQTVCVIDGGTKDSGGRLVDAIRGYYKTHKVDFVFSSHPDTDHASGLTEVLENLDCKTLVMHRPWEHSEDICHLFDDPKITPDKLAGRMERNLVAAHELEKIANSRKIPIMEPFAGAKNSAGTIMILGPDKAYYQSLLTSFRDMPEKVEAAWLPSVFKTLVGDAITWVDERLDLETLQDPPVGEVSAENNSSTVILFTIDGDKFLFTADAGSEALTRAADFAASQGISLSDLNLLQVPHHGSRRNVGPTILNRIKAKYAIISAGKEAEPKHPSKRVTNALKRRGSKVYATKGSGIFHRSEGIPNRDGWGNAVEIPFFDKVED